MKIKKARTLMGIITGSLSLSLGVIGIFIPLLPTTPFLLLAVYCYMHSSKSCYEWLINHPWLGPYIRDYKEGRGVPVRNKFLLLIVLWGTISVSALFVLSVWWSRLFLIIIALGVTVHVVKLKARKIDTKPALLGKKTGLVKPEYEESQ